MFAILDFKSYRGVKCVTSFRLTRGKILRLFTSQIMLSATYLVAMSAIAQSVPPLPGKIEPGAKDTNYFVCSVYSINNDSQARSMYGSTKNLWTEAVKGGKFELVSPSDVRVMAANVEAARNDIYAFYQKYAAAAFVRSPEYDSKGQKAIERVVQKCEPDSSRATNVKITNVSKDKFINLESDLDHVSYAVKQLKTPVADEKLAFMFDPRSLPSDVFERKEQIAKRAAKARELVQKANNSKFVKLSGSIKIAPFSFDSNSFNLADLKDFVGAYQYSIKPESPGQFQSFVSLPVYEVTVPASMMAYKPSSTDEAKLIEKERVAGELKLISYIQVSDAEFLDPKVKVKGVLSKIDVLNKKGAVLFSLSAK